MGKQRGSGIQAGETKVEKHKAITVVRWKSSTKERQHARILILVQISTRYIVLGEQISFVVLFASGKTTGLLGS